jgi:hypothetical protein
MRLTVFIAIAASLTLSPASAENLHYGPKEGIFGTGYKHDIEKDGSWRIVTEYRSADPYLALDVALYRAAELARDAGRPYVQVLGGYGTSRGFIASGFVYARASDSPAAPATCRHVKRCYTAEVAKVLDALSGPSGDEPGIPKPSLVDEHGRSVTVLGFGIGAVAWSQ